MKKLTIPDTERAILALQGEIRWSPESRYDRRLHGILLVAQGNSGREVARLLGVANRTVSYWVERFEQERLAGLLRGKRIGSPRRLSEEQVAQIDAALRMNPRDFGLKGNVWDGKTLAAFIRKGWDVTMSVRQCQRMLRKRSGVREMNPCTRSFKKP